MNIPRRRKRWRKHMHVMCIINLRGGLYNPAMAFVLANLFYFLLLLVLLAVSGVFSGVETVLFSLSRHDLVKMKKSANRLDALAASLLDRPRALLTALIMGNMTCNIVIFVLSSVVI